MKPAWPISLVLKAEKLYLSGLSCALVAKRLAVDARRQALAQGLPLPEPAGPSTEWVHRHLSARGVIRSKSKASGLRHGKDYKRLARMVKALADRDYSQPQIMRKLGVSWNFVDRVAPEARLPASLAQRRAFLHAERRRSRTRDGRRIEVQRLRMQGKGYDEIASELGLSRSTVYRDVQALGLVGVELRARRNEIRRLRRSGYQVQKIAARLGLDRHTVSAHLRRKASR